MEYCLLCGSAGNLLEEALPQTYLTCGCCGLVWMRESDRLNREAETAHYLTHQNDPEDARYRRFLSQLWEPMKEHLKGGDCGLDFGSGPGPTLHLMAREDGFPCAAYDPIFTPDESVLNGRYDFVTCSETAEHFFDPLGSFARLYELLKPGAWLGVMTVRYDDCILFRDWYYRRDPTHVVFYRNSTIRWLCDCFRFEEPVFVGDRVVLLRKEA